jgi:hypothetical protein
MVHQRVNSTESYLCDACDQQADWIVYEPIMGPRAGEPPLHLCQEHHDQYYEHFYETVRFRYPPESKSE